MRFACVILAMLCAVPVFAGTVLVHRGKMYAIGTDSKIYVRDTRGATLEEQKFRVLNVPFPDKVKALDLVAIEIGGQAFIDDDALYAVGSDGRLYAYRSNGSDGKTPEFVLSSFQLPEGVGFAAPRLGRSRR